MLGRIRAYVLPGDSERDEGFRREIARLSLEGLRVLGIIAIAVPICLLAAQLYLLPDRTTWPLRIANTAWVVGVGVGASLIARLDLGPGACRLVGWVSGWLVGDILIAYSLLLTRINGVALHYIPAQIATVVLVAVGTLPMRPLQTLSMGLAMWAFNILAGQYAVRQGMVETVDPDGTQGVFILMISLLSAALSALLYRERLSNYRAHREALEASESLHHAETRLLLSENAASLGRLAAALSHEINNPIGALRSAVDTIVLLAARQATSPPAEHPRLVLLQADLRRSIHDSATRLQQIVGRLQRFTNLDKASVQPVDLRGMLEDAAALLEPGIKGNTAVEIDMGPVAPLMCRPQQLSAVFSSLLHNAVTAIQNGDGRVRITVHEVNSLVEVRIQDNGRGLRPEELATIFDPGFKVTGRRVGTGNWSLFSARQIVREHGGEIQMESTEGKGTTVSVRLPRLAESALD